MNQPPAKPTYTRAQAVFRCTVCGLPFARIEGDKLIIESRHHGERHVNVLPLAELVTALETGESPELTTS